MITALYSGNLGLGHDLETIVRAVGLVNGRADLTVHFVGTGKARPSLENLAAQLALTNVEFHPPVRLRMLPGLLRKGDIHFVSQRPGTQGLIVPSKIYGILALGRPTVFIGPEDSEVGTIICESRSGIIVRPGDVDGTANAILELALAPKLRTIMGKRAREYYQERFGQERSVARIVLAIEGVVQPAALVVAIPTPSSEDKAGPHCAPMSVESTGAAHVHSDVVPKP